MARPGTDACRSGACSLARGMLWRRSEVFMRPFRLALLAPVLMAALAASPAAFPAADLGSSSMISLPRGRDIVPSCPVSYAIVVRNRGDADALDVELEDVIDTC